MVLQQKHRPLAFLTACGRRDCETASPSNSCIWSRSCYVGDTDACMMRDAALFLHPTADLHAKGIMHEHDHINEISLLGSTSRKPRVSDEPETQVWTEGTNKLSQTLLSSLLPRLSATASSLSLVPRVPGHQCPPSPTGASRPIPFA